jgi:hypothetical protein
VTLILAVKNGQRGLCTHFGQDHAADAELPQIRVSHSAPGTLVEACEHPKLAPLHLKVTATSGCDGFEPAVAN